jgi:hypothetical protein
LSAKRRARMVFLPSYEGLEARHLLTASWLYPSNILEHVPVINLSSAPHSASEIVLHNPAYDTQLYQPLNNSTSYDIFGTSVGLISQHNYGFYASSGKPLSVSASAPGGLGTNIDVLITEEIPSPFGITKIVIYDSQYNNPSTSVSYSFISEYDCIFIVSIGPLTGSIMPPSYSIHISGADLPAIKAVSPDGTNKFYITADAVMPTVTIQLNRSSTRAFGVCPILHLDNRY